MHRSGEHALDELAIVLGLCVQALRKCSVFFRPRVLAVEIHTSHDSRREQSGLWLIKASSVATTVAASEGEGRREVQQAVLCSRADTLVSLLGTRRSLGVSPALLSRGSMRPEPAA